MNNNKSYNYHFLRIFMKIKEMPKEGRPRERFLKLGPEALSDAELFAILLRTIYLKPVNFFSFLHSFSLYVLSA